MPRSRSSGSVARADGSVGEYSVPAVVIYPRHGGNRVGVVDWLNSAFYHFFPPTTEFGTFQFTLLSTGSYLFEKGYTYVSIQWNKAVTEIFGPAAPPDGQPHNHLVYGSIDRSADAWEILLDAARLLKDPSAYPGQSGPAAGGDGPELGVLAGRRPAARAARGGARSHQGLRRTPGPDDRARVLEARGRRSALRLPGRLRRAARRAGATRPSWCWRRRPTWWPSTRPSSASGRARSSPAIRPIPAGASTRWPGSRICPNRSCSLGLPNQNTADPRPIFRAAFDNLTRWAHGPHRVKPPASRYFEGQRGRDRCLHPDDGCATAISRAAFGCLTSSRRPRGTWPVRRSAATRRSILSGRTRSTRSSS